MEEEGKELHCSRRWPACGGGSGGGGGTYLFEFPAASYVSERVWCYGGDTLPPRVDSALSLFITNDVLS